MTQLKRTCKSPLNQKFPRSGFRPSACAMVGADYAIRFRRDKLNGQAPGNRSLIKRHREASGSWRPLHQLESPASKGVRNASSFWCLASEFSANNLKNALDIGDSLYSLCLSRSRVSPFSCVTLMTSHFFVNKTGFQPKLPSARTKTGNGRTAKVFVDRLLRYHDRERSCQCKRWKGDIHSFKHHQSPIPPASVQHQRSRCACR